MQGEHHSNFTEDGAWCFFADPRAVRYVGQQDRTYVGWLTKQGHVMIGTYDHRDGSVNSVMIKPTLQKDDHANPSLYIPTDGRAIIYYSAHNGKTMYYRQMETAEDISSFSAEQELPENTSGMHGYTYPNPIHLPQEQKQYVFWRGGNFKPNFSSLPDKEGTWSEPQTLIMGEGARPYVKYASNGKDTIWFAFTDGHPNIEPHNSIYCACIQDGNLSHADGSTIKPLSDLPMLPREADVVFDGNLHDTKAWIWDIAVDAQGHPAIVYAVFHANTDHRYWYSYWNGDSWESHEMTVGGSWFPQTEQDAVEREPFYSGGLILDHDNPANVYLSRSVNGIFEIEHWHTTNYGKTWESTAITSGSASNNVRPVLARNNGQEDALLLWMHGDYVHFTNYETVLKMKLVTRTQ
ncbi:BNR-4 repeat-containing protein [Paenibacillus plantarum]|nr:BNR-4 repeat-containing protein [Paenibacillus plantarum]